MLAILRELRGPEMTTHPAIFALPTLGTIDGDQDMEAQHSRRGKTFRISTLQVPFVVSFTGQNVPFALQPVAMAPRYLTNQKYLSSTERP